MWQSWWIALSWKNSPTVRGKPRNDAHCHCERNGVECGNLGGLLRRGKPPTCRGKPPRNDGKMSGLLRRGKTPRNDWGEIFVVMERPSLVPSRKNRDSPEWIGTPWNSRLKQSPSRGEISSLQLGEIVFYAIGFILPLKSDIWLFFQYLIKYFI